MLLPRAIKPELATLTVKAPSGNKWLHEIKFDGYRLMTFIRNGKVRLVTRGQQNWTDKLPNIVDALQALHLEDCILDGEIVALDNEGRSNFQRLQNAIHKSVSDSLIYFIFDIIYYAAYDLSAVSLIERKQFLKQLLNNASDSQIRYSDHVIGKGEQVFKNACELGLEGIISKARDSQYVQKRTRDWLKIKCNKSQEFVILGYTKPRGARRYFGSLLLGVYNKDKKLQYCGHVGTGFNESSLKMIYDLLKPNVINNSPFAKHSPNVRGVSWVKPELLAEVEYTEWTKEGVLRHPSFKGLRNDKVPALITREKEIIMPKASIRLSHPEKILYSENEITKQQLAEYYSFVSPWMLPYVKNRPLTLLRCPHGYTNKCFYQKHLHAMDQPNLHKIMVNEKGKSQAYSYLTDKEGLLQLVQLNVLEIHTWGCHVDKIERPDMITFDLDPAPDVEWSRVVTAAKHIRDELKELKLSSFVKLTGGKGLHVVIPIKRLYDWEKIKIFSHAFVNYMVANHPDMYTGTILKAKRTGKIFIDYLRNQRGATAIVPYSTRARAHATIAAPLSWEELEPRLTPQHFTLLTLFKRLQHLKKDPWAQFFKVKQSLPTF